MGLISFVGGDALPAPDLAGFSRLSPQPDGQGEQYYPLDIPPEVLLTPSLNEELAEAPEAVPTEQDAPDVTAQLSAFSHMPPVFVHQDTVQRGFAARQMAETDPSGTKAVLDVTEVSSGAPVLRALSRLQRLETEAGSRLTLNQQNQARFASPSDEAVRLSVQAPPRGETMIPGKPVAGLQPLPGAEVSSERESGVAELKAVTGLSMSAPLARLTEYQWAPARLAGGPAQWGQQLVDLLKDRVELQVNQNIKQAHIRLDPPDLGRLEVTVRVEGDRLNVQLNVSNPAVREALIQSMERLRMSLTPHHAGGVEVNVGQGGEQGKGDRWQQDRILAGRREWQEESVPTEGTARDWLNTLV